MSDNNEFVGKSAKFESGSIAFVGNNGDDFYIKYVNAEGDVTEFLLTPEAAYFTAQSILEQFSE